MQQVSLGIAIPGASMPMPCVASLVSMMGDLASGSQPSDKFELGGLGLSMKGGSILPAVRHEVIAECLQMGASHILMLDSDMTYPSDLVRRLANHGRPFVACNATTRTTPVRWVAKDSEGQRIDSRDHSGLGKVASVGLAVALIERRVFEAMDPPWFNFEVDQAPGETPYRLALKGEDTLFCQRMRQAGFQPMVDHDLSLQIGHYGSYLYGAMDVLREGGE